MNETLQLFLPIHRLINVAEPKFLKVYQNIPCTSLPLNLSIQDKEKWPRLSKRGHFLSNPAAIMLMLFGTWPPHGKDTIPTR
jgi:hypothetical protein